MKPPRWFWPLGAMALVLALTELAARGPAPLERPWPSVVFLTGLGAVALAGLTGGARGAVASALLYVAYTFRLVAEETPLALDREGAVSALMVAALAAAVAVPTVHLKRREDALHARLVQAERDRADAFEATNRELLAVNRVLTDFAHVVSHDLKEPVRAMEVTLAALDEDHRDALPDEGRELLRRAREADRRLAALVEALLDYSRVSRVDPGAARPVGVAQILTSTTCRARYVDLAEARRARLLFPSRSDEADVVVAPEVLALVLGNLVTNALKHNPRPNPMVRVRVTPAGRPGFTTIAVEDDGPGFSADSLARYAAALRGDAPTRGAGRSGFGLLIVARGVERLGGRLEVGASPEDGAAVRLELPAPARETARDERPDGDARAPTPDAAGAAARRGVA